MNILRKIYDSYRSRRRWRELDGVFRRFQEFTLIPSQTYVANLLLAERVKDVAGCVVECGVWKGGMSAGMATVLGPGREYFLFDSFEGLPPAKEVDGVAALRWQSDKESPQYFNNCIASPDEAHRAMTLSGVPSFHLVKGWFNETLPNFTPPQPIALLRLDGDWYDSTMVCMESLVKWMAPRGLILVDDYYCWDGCTRAVHDFLSRTSATERIQSFWDVCYIEKRAAPGQ